MALSPTDRDLVIRTIVGEAGGEPLSGWAAVAHSIRNRSLSKRYPNSPGKVVKQKKQYSTWNKGKGGNSLARNARSGKGKYDQIGKVVDDVFSGKTLDPTGGATHYYAPRGMKGGRAPYWWKDESRRGGGSITLGNHIFAGNQKKIDTANAAVAGDPEFFGQPITSFPETMLAKAPIPAPRARPPGLKPRPSFAENFKKNTPLGRVGVAIARGSMDPLKDTPAGQLWELFKPKQAQAAGGQQIPRPRARPQTMRQLPSVGGPHGVPGADAQRFNTGRDRSIYPNGQNPAAPPTPGAQPGSFAQRFRGMPQAQPQMRMPPPRPQRPPPQIAQPQMRMPPPRPQQQQPQMRMPPPRPQQQAGAPPQSRPGGSPMDLLGMLSTAKSGGMAGIDPMATAGRSNTLPPGVVPKGGFKNPLAALFGGLFK